MRTLIINGGNIEDDFALSFLKQTEYDFLISVDKGLEFTKRAGLVPDLILGDFDSADGSVKAFFDEMDIPTRVFNPIKDSTDMEIAMGEAIERGSSEILILGATGSRLDHVIGSIKNLSMAVEAGVDACIYDPHNKIRMIRKGITISRSGQYGKYVSLHALGGSVSDLTLKGFYYNLDNYQLDAFSALGVSNEIVDETASISFSDGTLLVIESRD